MIILDEFSGAGGAAMGIHLALKEAGIKHEIIGVDIKPQPRYPFKFIQDDAIKVLSSLQFRPDFIWASPPCQKYSAGRYWVRGRKSIKEHPDLISTTRQYLNGEIPWVIENVEGSPLQNPTMLCGSMFGMAISKGYLRRHRLFESNFKIVQPLCSHGGQAVSVCGHGAGGMWGYRKATADEARQLLQIDWMNRDEMKEAVPPAYSRYIMQQFLKRGRKRILI